MKSTQNIQKRIDKVLSEHKERKGDDRKVKSPIFKAINKMKK